MTVNHLKQMAVRATLLGALLVSPATVTFAQKADGPPKTTKGAVKSNPKADKGQATAEAARVASRDRKAAKSAFKMARRESKSLVAGIRFSRSEKTVIKDISKRYDRQFKALQLANKEADGDGKPDAAIIPKIDVIRLQQRAELRAALTPAQQVRFDTNCGTTDAKRA